MFLRYRVLNPDGFEGVDRLDPIEFGSHEEVNAAIRRGALLTPEAIARADVDAIIADVQRELDAWIDSDAFVHADVQDEIDSTHADRNKEALADAIREHARQVQVQKLHELAADRDADSAAALIAAHVVSIDRRSAATDAARAVISKLPEIVFARSAIADGKSG